MRKKVITNYKQTLYSGFFFCWHTVLLHKVLFITKSICLLSIALSSGFQRPDSISVAFVKNVDCSFMND